MPNKPGRPRKGEERPKAPREPKPMGAPRQWQAEATARLNTFVPPAVAAAWADKRFKRQVEALADLHQKEDKSKTP